MITQIIVQHPDTPQRFDCHLGGFGTVRCGKCRTPFKSTKLKSECRKCGCFIVETRRVAGRKFEGSWGVKG